MFTVYCTTSIASQSLYPYSCCRTHSRAPRRAGAKQGARRHIACYSQSLDTDEIRHLLGSAYLRPEFEGYTDEHVTELVEAAAGLISVIDDLRPLDHTTFNAAYEIWKAIAAVPAADRVRILDELEPGAVFSLWKATVSRYVMAENRKEELFKDFFIWDDFPSEPGQVYTYEGLCEQFVYQKPLSPLAVDSSMQSKLPRQVPWLKPNPMSMATPQERFTQQFFLSSRTGLLHSRINFNLPGVLKLLKPLTPPIYNRVEIGLTLTPNSSDAGADACITYPVDPILLKQQQAAGVALSKEDLPNPLWPAPLKVASWSPLSFTGRDYVRVVGPGFYVGCAYRKDEQDNYAEDEHVYFALFRRY
eukprot:GHUV01006447.1.p1 GENE.GHUV01006447.1~~GHUV01006447.1.p1  ORF type:complete len:360 (+),score=62.56 GHUV01006447.1:75-1154(+)